MQSKEIPKEKDITLKDVEKYFTKTLISALTLALVSAFLSSYAFYYKTNSSIDDLNSVKIETKQDIKELKSSVSAINEKLSSTGYYTNSNVKEIETLKQDIKDIKTSQDNMLKLLYEMKSKAH